MNIGIIGVGYVGLVTGACLADLDNEVMCADINQKKINDLKNNIVPFFEPGLDELLAKSTIDSKLKFTTDIKSTVLNNQTLVIAVDTPQSFSGEANLKYVFDVATEIAENMTEHKFIIIKSTVPVGTCNTVKNLIHSKLKQRNLFNITFDVISNPEFLREGSAINDFTTPDRIICGYESSEARLQLEKLYKPFSDNNIPVIYMDLASSEMTKYAANAMLATKISFTNEMALICEKTGANIENVCKGMASDKRIGPHFINPGIGYGGSCFPKDVSALIYTAKEHGLSPNLIQAVKSTNLNQRKHFVQKILNYFNKNISDKTFSVWGLSYKPNTDDMRDAPSVTIINELLKLGSKIKAYDPKAIPNTKLKIQNDNLSYHDSALEALTDSDALLLLTEWNEFKNPDLVKIKSLMNQPVIFDGRNLFDTDDLQKNNFTYFPVGNTHQ